MRGIIYERFKYISRAVFEKSFLYMPCKGVIVAVRPSESIPPGNISAAIVVAGGWLLLVRGMKYLMILNMNNVTTWLRRRGIPR